jgi:hypothetical protein
MTKRDELLAEADAIVRGTDEDLLDNGELRVIEISEGINGKVATVRSVNGQSVVYPHPESATILVGKPVYFDLLAKGPRIIRELVDLVESSEITPKSAKNTPES